MYHRHIYFTAKSVNLGSMHMCKALISNPQRCVYFFYDAFDIILMDFTVYGRENKNKKKTCKRINMRKKTHKKAVEGGESDTTCRVLYIR